MVLEIGCAYGREAGYITTKVQWYLGIDICREYIEMARLEVPKGTFVVADMMEYDFGVGLNVIFSFASFVHNPKEDIALLLQRITSALNPGGVVFISLKRRERYETDEVDDGVSIRRFYYYTRDDILECAPENLSEVFYDEQSRQEEWFTIILQKQ